MAIFSRKKKSKEQKSSDAIEKQRQSAAKQATQLNFSSDRMQLSPNQSPAKHNSNNSPILGSDILQPIQSPWAAGHRDVSTASAPASSDMNGIEVPHSPYVGGHAPARTASGPAPYPEPLNRLQTPEVSPFMPQFNQSPQQSRYAPPSNMAHETPRSPYQQQPDRITSARYGSSDGTPVAPSASNQSPNPQQKPRTRNIHYPWSRKQLTSLSSTSPFPRYGHAASDIASIESNEIFIFGGLKGRDMLQDLWAINASTFECRLIVSDSPPAPRIGHSCVLVDNAFIVYGGDTKQHPTDKLDTDLHVLNTLTRQWRTIKIPETAHPGGRYGHSLCSLGSKLYLFGGQRDSEFFNDIYEFDLENLLTSKSQGEWVLLPVSGNAPNPRTNHSMIIYRNTLILFGGTDSVNWFNDVWCFDLSTSQWTEISTAGFVPVPCEGHTAALVDDAMYVLGGRSAESEDLNLLSALKLSSMRWFMFQNMGTGPSPRSGHSMSVSGSKIYVLGGEPSTGVAEDLDCTFVLDTSRIRYPAESANTTPRLNKVFQAPTAARQVTSPAPDTIATRSVEEKVSAADNTDATKTEVGEYSTSTPVQESSRSIDQAANPESADTTPVKANKHKSRKQRMSVPGGWAPTDSAESSPERPAQSTESLKIPERGASKDSNQTYGINQAKAIPVTLGSASPMSSPETKKLKGPRPPVSSVTGILDSAKNLEMEGSNPKGTSIDSDYSGVTQQIPRRRGTDEDASESLYAKRGTTHIPQEGAAATTAAAARMSAVINASNGKLMNSLHNSGSKSRESSVYGGPLSDSPTSDEISNRALSSQGYRGAERYSVGDEGLESDKSASRASRHRHSMSLGSTIFDRRISVEDPTIQGLRSQLQWYEVELHLARKAGYVPSSAQPAADSEVNSRAVNRLSTMSVNENLLKELIAVKSELDKLKSDIAKSSITRDPTSASSKGLSTIGNDSLTLPPDVSIASKAESSFDALGLAQEALAASEMRADSLLRQMQEDMATYKNLEETVNILKAKNNELETALANSLKEETKQRELAAASSEAASKASRALNEGISKLLADQDLMQREISNDKIKELEEKLKDMEESHSTAVKSVEELESKLKASESKHSTLLEELESVRGEHLLFKQNKEQTDREFGEHKAKYSELEQKHKELQEKVQELDNLKQQHSELQKAHESTLSYVKSSDMIVSKMKEELNRQRAENSELKEELVRLQEEADKGQKVAELEQALAEQKEMFEARISDLKTQLHETQDERDVLRVAKQQAARRVASLEADLKKADIGAKSPVIGSESSPNPAKRQSRNGRQSSVTLDALTQELDMLRSQWEQDSQRNAAA
ncbi:hypothetical protein CANCADRAFT_31017 [Tortispora caseinolytica NRRL Y-17796]|uniref:Uncharacterized protein n=1 Tax=Tortispora caseinolytica NRRL Y-17796 TaxID=767744 RepID=A0A1E4TE31_9ASCO|nr:hypothetical protein CANCADRAFT_31017 [Tortispora caseinolytica NRRL Y-17796]